MGAWPCEELQGGGGGKADWHVVFHPLVCLCWGAHGSTPQPDSLLQELSFCMPDVTCNILEGLGQPTCCQLRALSPPLTIWWSLLLLVCVPAQGVLPGRVLCLPGHGQGPHHAAHGAPGRPGAPHHRADAAAMTAAWMVKAAVAVTRGGGRATSTRDLCLGIACGGRPIQAGRGGVGDGTPGLPGPAAAPVLLTLHPLCSMGFGVAFLL